jgi:uncharacterized protein (TIGR03086 family)
VSDDTIDLLRRALDQTAILVAAVQAKQLSWPTPCSEWDVRELLRHVICTDLRNLAIASRGETADWKAEPAPLGDDPASDFRRGAKALLDSWSRGDLDTSVPMPGGATAPLQSRADQQIAELAVHGWDIARSTGQATARSRGCAAFPRLVEAGAAPPVPWTGQAFGHEVPVSGDAAIYDRLAGWFGRDPAWSPAPAARH